MGFSHYCFTWKIINLMLTLQSIGWNELKNKEKKKKVNDTGIWCEVIHSSNIPPPPHQHFTTERSPQRTWLISTSDYDRPPENFYCGLPWATNIKRERSVACILLKNNWKITNKRNICLIYHYAKMHFLFFSSHSFIIVTVVYDIESYS